MSFTFEDKQDAVDGEIKKRRGKWFLTSMSHLDFDDVSQIIRAHIYRKWHLWNQQKALEPWINRIISNQIKNLIRNNYGTFAKPCVKCPFNESADSEGMECGYTKSGTQCNECPLYKKWSRSKKNAHDIKMAKSYDAHDFEISDTAFPIYDMEAAAARLHEKMKNHLTPRQYEAYQYIIIDALEDSEAAIKIGLKSSENGRGAGYRQIKNFKKLFKDKAAAIMRDEDIFFE